jgi:cytosine/uracil/thiamine/allantoin permease
MLFDFFHNNTFRTKFDKNSKNNKIRSLAHHISDIMCFQIIFKLNCLAMFTTPEKISKMAPKFLKFFIVME